MAVHSPQRIIPSSHVHVFAGRSVQVLLGLCLIVSLYFSAPRAYAETIPASIIELYFEGTYYANTQENRNFICRSLYGPAYYFEPGCAGTHYTNGCYAGFSCQGFFVTLIYGCPPGYTLSGKFCVYTGPTRQDLQEHKNEGEPQECRGNPCDPATGNKYQSESDYSGGKTELAFVRSYNSSSDRDVDLGVGWSSTFHRGLQIITATTVLVRSADGRGEPILKENGLWVPDTDSKLTLTQDTTGFTAIFDDGTQNRYDTEGRLLSATDRAGKTTTYTYDTAGKLLSVIGPFGHMLTFAYDTTGHLQAMTDPAGGTYTYSYDSNNNLTQVTYPDGSSKTYHYENPAFPHHLTGISDENDQRFATYAYDSEGRAISTEHAGGQERYGFDYE